MSSRLPAGPPLPSFMQAALSARYPVSFLRWCRRRYGDCFLLRFPFFGRVVYLADPEAVKEVFTGDPKRFHAGEANAAPLGPALGTYSLLTLDEEAHMSQRKLILPPFHGDNVRRYGEVMAEVADRELERWPIGRPFALRPSMQAITLDVILRAVFGVRDEDRLNEFRRRIPRMVEASNLIIWVPALRRDLGRRSPWRKFTEARAAVDELLFDEIRLRRSEANALDGGDVLSLLISARHEDGSPMTDGELRDELMTLLTAGHETTATALAWAFERLLRHPDVLARLVETLEAGQEEYLDAVVKETLRVRPVVADAARRLTEEVTVAGHTIPAGMIALASIALIHLRADVYPEPEAFRPERFLEGQPEPYTWIPFGGGVRRCIGAAFATFETKVVLRTILARVRLRASAAAPEPQRAKHVTIVPAKGAEAVLIERIPSQAASLPEPEIARAR